MLSATKLHKKRETTKRLPIFLFTLFHLGFQLSQNIEVTKRCACGNVLNLWRLVLLGNAGLLGGSLLLLTLRILEGAAVREDDALRILVELNHLEGQRLTLNGLRAILLLQMLGSSEAFHVLVECNNGTLFEQLGNLTLVDRTNGVLLLKDIPGIVLQLLVAKAETTVLLVDIEHDNVDLGTHLSEL